LSERRKKGARRFFLASNYEKTARRSGKSSIFGYTHGYTGVSAALENKRRYLTFLAALMDFRYTQPVNRPS
jgi:hypothetical protein